MFIENIKIGENHIKRRVAEQITGSLFPVDAKRKISFARLSVKFVPAQPEFQSLFSRALSLFL